MSGAKLTPWLWLPNWRAWMRELGGCAAQVSIESTGYVWLAWPSDSDDPAYEGMALTEHAAKCAATRALKRIAGATP